MVGLVVNAVGTIIQASSFSLAQLIVGRIINGLGLGLVAATVPSWQSECSKASHRGAFVVLEGLFIISGVVVAQWIEFGLSFAPGAVSWRFPLAFPIIFPIIAICSIQKLPESPRWLIKHGRAEEARLVLSALSDLDPNSRQVSIDMMETQGSLERVGETDLKNLARNGEDRLLHRTFLGCLFLFFLQV